MQTPLLGLSKFSASSREAPQSDAPDATGYKGFYYHFLDMRTGKRVWQCELSLIDTALLIAGVLVAGCYFDAEGEREIREMADALYRRVDWRWAQNGKPEAFHRDGSRSPGFSTMAGRDTTKRRFSTFSVLARRPFRSLQPHTSHGS